MSNAPRPWRFVPCDASDTLSGHRILDANGETIMTDREYYPHIWLDIEDWQEIVDLINAASQVVVEKLRASNEQIKDRLTT